METWETYGSRYAKHIGLGVVFLEEGRRGWLLYEEPGILSAPAIPEGDIPSQPAIFKD